jgi:hypothetical protein
VTTSARDALVDILMGTDAFDSVHGPGEVLRCLARPDGHAALVRWIGDTIGLDVLVQDVLDAYGPDSIVHSLAAADVLVQAESETDDGGQGLLWVIDIPSETQPGETAPMAHIGNQEWGAAVGAVPVYRIGVGRA